MTTARVAVLGSTNMDLVVVVDRPPERGETVTGRRWFSVPGGKGANQALAAARAGGRVRMLGAVGDDDFGRQARGVLADNGVDTSALATSTEPTGTAHIVVDGGGGNAIVVVPGANGAVTELTDAHREAIVGSDILLLQLELPLPVVVAGAAFARDHGVSVVLTPAPVVPLPDELLAAVDVLVPNEPELAALTGGRDVAAGLTALLDRVGAVAVTLGERGCRYVTRGAEPVHVPAPQVQAVDTTAAGDTFVGAMAVALGEGRDAPEVLRWATAAAALSVQRPGASTSMPHRREIETMFLESSWS
ncbi:ribokinase [Pseudonocardia nigra]|uniref:ribokinase n=1 Tax=Pseudonocardia nigra TaxID=1921578 RepID=UPI001C5EA33B|nr:ribokinase [Pseudonocardia nigra]